MVHEGKKKGMCDVRLRLILFAFVDHLLDARMWAASIRTCWRNGMISPRCNMCRG